MTAALKNRMAGSNAKPGAKVVSDAWVDPWLGGLVLALVLLGLVMLASASMALMAEQGDSPFYLFLRQLLFVSVAVIVAFAVV